MFLKSRRLGKTFATELALIWPLSRVDSLVHGKVPGLRKSLGTVTALKWLLTCVGSNVNLKRRKSVNVTNKSTRTRKSVKYIN